MGIHDLGRMKALTSISIRGLSAHVQITGTTEIVYEIKAKQDHTHYGIYT
jgi:hypothetical protein